MCTIGTYDSVNYVHTSSTHEEHTMPAFTAPTLDMLRAAREYTGRWKGER